MMMMITVMRASLKTDDDKDREVRLQLVSLRKLGGGGGGGAM